MFAWVALLYICLASVGSYYEGLGQSYCFTQLRNIATGGDFHRWRKLEAAGKWLSVVFAVLLGRLSLVSSLVVIFAQFGLSLCVYEAPLSRWETGSLWVKRATYIITWGGQVDELSPYKRWQFVTLAVVSVLCQIGIILYEVI